MADLTAEQIVWQWHEGSAERIALFAIRNATAGDNASLSSYFAVIKRATALPTTSSSAAAACQVGVQFVTIPDGWSADAGFILVVGVAA